MIYIALVSRTLWIDTCCLDLFAADYVSRREEVVKMRTHESDHIYSEIQQIYQLSSDRRIGHVVQEFHWKRKVFD